MSRPTVVDLKPASKRKIALPPIVHSVRQHAKTQLVGLLQKLFDSTDDALFEMADRSQTDADQHLFFDSMRQIRLQRPQVIKAFLREFFAEFERNFALTPDSTTNPRVDLESADVDDLKLVANEELELSVAISGIVSKVTSQYSGAITPLTARLDHVCKTQSITDRTNPLGPHTLSRAFVVSTDVLEVDIKIKIILLKLFERMVMQQLAPMYKQANDLMIEAGVLPDIGSNHIASGSNAAAGAPGLGLLNRAGVTPIPAGGQPIAPAAVPTTPATGTPVPAAGTVANMPLTPRSGVAAEFSVLQQLLAGARSAVPANSAPPTASLVEQNPGDIIPTSGVPDGLGGWHSAPLDDVPVSSTPLSTEQLLTLLTTLQTETVAQPLDMSHQPTQVDLRSVLRDKSPDITGGDPALAMQPDDDVINVVGMLFDYILNDRNLAIPMKALISRLQIPVVKLAVVDKTFFNQTSHPARLLLNELSSAGIGWSSAQELRRDALYNKIESIVLTVLNGPSEQSSLYVDLLEELREFLRKDTKRHALVEQRVLETETGKARARAAKDAVQKLINQKASGLRLPACAGRFVGDYWSKVLVLTATKYGQEGEDWEQQAAALDDLMWSLQPLSERADIDKRDQLLGGLLERLEAGVSTVLHNRTQREELMAGVAKELEQAIAHDNAYLDDDDGEAVATVEPHAPPKDYAELVEIRLTEPIPEPKPITEIDPAFTKEVNKLAVGGWIEVGVPAEVNLEPELMAKVKGRSKLRCKLTTIIDPGDIYMFVNRRGMKVAEFSKRELVLLASINALTLLDESEVFDRALQAVVGNLRKMQNEPAPID